VRCLYGACTTNKVFKCQKTNLIPVFFFEKNRGIYLKSFLQNKQTRLKLWQNYRLKYINNGFNSLIFNKVFKLPHKLEKFLLKKKVAKLIESKMV
jgi:hypothetical protein